MRLRGTFAVTRRRLPLPGDVCRYQRDVCRYGGRLPLPGDVRRYPEASQKNRRRIPSDKIAGPWGGMRIICAFDCKPMQIFWDETCARKICKTCSLSVKCFVRLTIVTKFALTWNSLPTGPCAPKFAARSNLFTFPHAPIFK